MLTMLLRMTTTLTLTMMSREHRGGGDWSPSCNISFHIRGVGLCLPWPGVTTVQCDYCDYTDHSEVWLQWPCEDDRRSPPHRAAQSVTSAVSVQIQIQQYTLWSYKLIQKHLLKYCTKFHYIDFVWPRIPSSLMDIWYLNSSQQVTCKKIWEMASRKKVRFFGFGDEQIILKKRNFWHKKVFIIGLKGNK